MGEAELQLHPIGSWGCGHEWTMAHTKLLRQLTRAVAEWSLVPTMGTILKFGGKRGLQAKGVLLSLDSLWDSRSNR